jgi:transposase
MNLREEPPDHAIGRSRGGLSTKIHQLVDGRGRPLVIALTPGQSGDSPMLIPLLAHLAVYRIGPGRPRTRPEALLADKAYSSRGTRAMLRARGVRTVIPQPSDQIAHRQRRGRAGGRPPALTEPRGVVGFEGILGALLAALDGGVITSIHRVVEQRH